MDGKAQGQAREAMPTALTPLERELIAYLEKLSGQYSDLEQRSNEMITRRQSELEDLLNLLFASQASLVEGLSGFVNALEPSEIEAGAETREAMKQSLEAIRQAQTRLASLKPIEQTEPQPEPQNGPSRSRRN